MIKYLLIGLLALSSGCSKDKPNDSAKSNDSVKPNGTVKSTDLLIANDSGKSEDSVESKYQKLIGKDYRDINEIEGFNDLKDVGGALVHDGDHSGYTINHCQRDNLHVLILESAKNLPDGTARYTAIDILEISGIKEGSRLEFVSCRLDGKVDSKIFAICEYEETEFLTKVVKAWKANIEKGKIEEMAVTGIDCVNVSYGGD